MLRPTKEYSYEELRDIVCDGDIVFVHGSRKSIISAIIMLVTRSQFSHVFICFCHKTKNKDVRWLLVEAQKGSKRRILNLSYYENKKFSIIKAPTKWSNVEDIALERVGKVKYGLCEAIYVGLVDLFWNAFRIKLPKFNIGTEICSEFVARVYNLPEKNVSPQKLWTQLLQLGYVEK